MTVETRYFRSDQQNVNGLLAYMLGISQTGISKYAYGTPVPTTSVYAYPNGDSTPLDWIPVPAGTHYTTVDEAVADDTDYVYSTKSDATDTYTHQSISIGTKKILAVQIIVRFNGAGFRCGFVIGGTFYSQTLAAVSTWTTRALTWYTNPATGQDWTESDVNNALLRIVHTASDGVLTSVSQIYLRVYVYDDTTLYFKFKVFKRDAGGTETAVTDYVTLYSALASVFKDDAGALRSITVNIPETALASTDSIVVRIYTQAGTGTPALRAIFTTEQLGAVRLDSATWTFYFYLEGAKGTGGIFDYWYWDTTTYNSRIENFTWTPAPPPVVAKRIIGDGLVWIVC